MRLWTFCSLYQNDKERQRLRMAGEAVVGLGKNVILRRATMTDVIGVTAAQNGPLTANSLAALYNSSQSVRHLKL